MSAVRVLPWVLHVALEYLAGIFLVLSPFAFGFTGSIALPVLLGAGVAVLAVAVLSRGRLGVAGVLPASAHAALDYLIAFFLLVSPFVFGFLDDTDALLVSVMVGLGLLVVSLLTRYPQPKTAPPGAVAPGEDLGELEGGEPVADLTPERDADADADRGRVDEQEPGPGPDADRRNRPPTPPADS